MKTIQGLLIGFTVGAIDCGLFYLSGQPMTIFDVLTAVSFWTITGMLIHISAIDLHPVVKCIILAVVMNIPWLIDFTGREMLNDVLAPIIVLSVFFGAIIGYFSGKTLITVKNT